MLIVLAALMLGALAQGIEQSPIIVAVLALLAVPGVTSFVTGIAKSIAPSVKPETLVYIASLLLTGLWLWQSGGDLPGIDFGNPAASVALWLTWAKVNSSSAQAVYDLLKAALPGLFAKPA